MSQIPEHLARKAHEALTIAIDATTELHDECGGNLIARAGLAADLVKLERLRSRANARMLQDDDWLDDLGGTSG